MVLMQLPRDFKEFLQLLNSKQVEYLLVGGFAVGYHGYPRATGDMDVWVHPSPQSAEGIVEALVAFGFAPATLTAELFTKPRQVVRIGLPPLRIELLTTVSGVEFADCYRRRTIAVLDGVEVPIICLEDLKANKKAAGRLKDLNDLEHLP